MQEEDSTSGAINLAAAMRQDGIKLWSYRCHREAEIQLASYHVQDRSSNKEELIRGASSDISVERQEYELHRPPDIHKEAEATVLSEVDVAEDVATSINIDDSSSYSETNEEHVRIYTVTKEEATLLQDETAKMWQYRGLVTVESHYQEQLTTTHELIETSHNDNQHSEISDKGLEVMDYSQKQQDEVISDSEESFHSLEEFVPDELNKLSLVVAETESESYDDAEKMLLESIAVQTVTPEVQDTASQTIDAISDSVCVQTDNSTNLLDASVNTVTVTTSNTCTNTIIIATNNAATNTVTMVTIDDATSTEVVELVDMETNTTLKTTTDAIIQTEKLLMSRSQSEYESLIDKYKKYIEALKTEVTQEKSQRLVAEQMVTIVQSEVEGLRQRNIDLTSQQIKLENDLSGTKVEYLQSQKMLKERDQKIVELNDSLSGTSLLVKKLEEQSTQVLMGRGGIDYMLEAKLASGRALEAEQKVEVLQAELLHSHTEVKSLLDKISELTREKAENVSHVVHTQLLQIADEKALQAESKCRQLENEVLSLKRQLQTTNEPSETTTPSSLSTVTGYKPLSSYSLYGTATTSSTSFLHTYPSTLSYYGNSSYTTGSSYTYSSQPNYGGLLLGKSESSSQSQPTSSYGFMLTTSSEISGLNFGHSYQTAITTTSPVLTSTSSKPVTTVTTKNRNQVTMDTMEKDKNRQQGFQSTEASLVLPGLVDSTKMSFQTQPKPITSQESGDSSDWSSSDDDDNDPYANSPLKPSMLASKAAQWEWRAQQEHESHQTTSPKVIARSSSVKTRPPVAPKPVRTKALHRSLSNPSGDTVIISEEATSFNEPAKAPNLKKVSRAKGPKGRTLPQRKKNKHLEEPELATITVPEI